MREYQWFEEIDSATLKDWVEKYLEGNTEVDYYKLVYPRLELVRADLTAALKRADAFNWIADPGGDRCLATRVFRMIRPESCDSELKHILLPWLRHQDRRTLYAITDYLVAAGADDILEAVTPLFSDPDSMLRAQARYGAIVALKSGRMESNFRKFVMEHCITMLLHPKVGDDMYDPLRLMLAIDSSRTMNVLQDSRILRVDHPLLSSILSTLNKHDIRIAPDFLHNTIKEYFGKNDFMGEQIQVAAIAGLLLQKDPVILNLVENIKKNPKLYSKYMLDSVIRLTADTCKVNKSDTCKVGKINSGIKIDYNVEVRRAALTMFKEYALKMQAQYPEWLFEVGTEDLSYVSLHAHCQRPCCKRDDIEWCEQYADFMHGIGILLGSPLSSGAGIHGRPIVIDYSHHIEFPMSKYLTCDGVSAEVFMNECAECLDYFPQYFEFVKNDTMDAQTRCDNGA